MFYSGSLSDFRYASVASASLRGMRNCGIQMLSRPADLEVWPACCREGLNSYGQVAAIIFTLSTFSFGALAADAAGG